MREFDPIQALTNDHYYILLVVDVLKGMADGIRRGEIADVQLLSEAATFMQEFTNTIHHCREEALIFPALEEQCHRSVAHQLTKHRNEQFSRHRLLAELRDAIDALRPGTILTVTRLAASLDAIVRIYPDHIMIEEAVIFPMALRLIDEDAFDGLKQRFQILDEKFECIRSCNIERAIRLSRLFDESAGGSTRCYEKRY